MLTLGFNYQTSTSFLKFVRKLTTMHTIVITEIKFPWITVFFVQSFDPRRRLLNSTFFSEFAQQILSGMSTVVTWHRLKFSRNFWRKSKFQIMTVFPSRTSDDQKIENDEKFSSFKKKIKSRMKSWSWSQLAGCTAVENSINYNTDFEVGVVL